MAWAGSLALDYRCDVVRGQPRTVLHDRHDGPLRVLASLYPEAPAVCHNVLVHPPGGLVGGDALRIDLNLADGAHALVTTPGATRYYRSTSAAATQAVHATLGAGARLEWLPLETIAYSGCLGASTVGFRLAPGAEMIGWDLLALGLPASNQAFERGRFEQRIEWPGRWLERGVIDAADRRLLDSPIGWAGHRALGTLWFAAGTPLDGARRDALLDAARASIEADAARASIEADAALRLSGGATAPDDGLIVVRVLAPRVEPAMRRLAAVWSAWRGVAWQMAPCAPRVWRT